MREDLTMQKFSYLTNMFFQWWLSSDQILFRRFLNHEAMLLSLAFALLINLWGVFVLYVPINYLIPKDTIERIRSYLRKRFPRLNRHFERIHSSAMDQEADRYGLLRSKEKRNKAISGLIETYEYDYLFIFLLAAVPVPFLGTIMTGGAIFAIETLEIRYGLLVIIIGKIAKVFALSAIAYFAYFI